MHNANTFRASTFRLIAAQVLALLLSLAAVHAQAHTPLFDCFDNGDDTITCEGGFSDGSSAAGVGIRVLDAQGKVLEQGDLGEDGSILLKRPAGEFSVVFAAGEEHSITVLGDDII
ncbi:MAG TPA: hypothetical protein VGE69_16515 [Pseudomonadales bacterium]